MSVEFNDYTPQVQDRIISTVQAWLYEAGGEVQSRAKRNTRVDTGRTKGSWEYRVAKNKLEVTIGSNAENAIWEEFGTGIYAEKGNGRKTPWSYRGPDGKWYTTRGKKGTKAFRRAHQSVKRAAMANLSKKLKAALG